MEVNILPKTYISFKGIINLFLCLKVYKLVYIVNLSYLYHQYHSEIFVFHYVSIEKCHERETLFTYKR